MTDPSWGSNLEILHCNLAAHRWMRPVEDYAGCVFPLETSEELPSAHEVFRVLRNTGERGLLAQFPAVIVNLPKATSLRKQCPTEARERYRADQRDVVLSVFARYSPDATTTLPAPAPGHYRRHGKRLLRAGPGGRSCRARRDP